MYSNSIVSMCAEPITLRAVLEAGVAMSALRSMKFRLSGFNFRSSSCNSRARFTPCSSVAIKLVASFLSAIIHEFVEALCENALDAPFEARLLD